MDKEKVRDTINALYDVAGMHKQYSGEVNERVAEVVGIMLKETTKCSAALAWVPTPSGGPATITWIARNFGRSVILRLRGSTSVICARRVVAVWDSELQLAGMGL